jgi:hypothetical protein
MTEENTTPNKVKTKKTALSIDKLVDTYTDEISFDELNASEKLREIPAKLHGKYLKMYAESKFQRIKLAGQLKDAKNLRRDWWAGRLDLSELKKLGWEPWPFEKAPIIAVQDDLFNEYPETSKILQEIEIADIYIFTLNDILKKLAGYNYEIKNWLEWQRISNNIAS